MADSWFTHEALKDRISAHSWNGDQVRVWEKRESYLEYYFAIPLLHGPRQAEEALSRGYSWGDQEIDRARPNLVGVTTNKFLSRSFENYTGLSGRKPRCTNDSRDIVAEYQSRSDFVNESVVTIRRRELLGFLNEKRKGILYCFRSHRFSEKTLDELEVEPIYQDHSGENYHVIEERRELEGNENEEIFGRSRVKSFSLLLGKSFHFAP